MYSTAHNLGSLAAQPVVVSVPQTPRIVEDLSDCVHQLKAEFGSNKLPITDDNIVLRRMCAKLEYLLQYELKDRYTMLGKRKDYWDYFCDCLAVNKGANDGIKYVKSLRDYKTSLGKGRAFIRFALVHQRLADSLQQCVIHPKTGDWYSAGSVWMQPKVCSAVITDLYDLNDIYFDLSPGGYDLDNSWPSFARSGANIGSWAVPASRRSSISSMDTLSISSDLSEVNRLQHELASAETARSVLAENVSTLEQERQKAEITVWMTQGELSALQDQLKSTLAKHEELQQRYSSLEHSHTKLQTEKQQQEHQLGLHSAEMETHQQQLAEAEERLAQQEVKTAQLISEEKSHFASQADAMQLKLNEVTKSRDLLSAKLASLEATMEQMHCHDVKKSEQISRLEQQMSTLEDLNKELQEKLSANLSSREQDADNQMQSALILQDLVAKLQDAETENLRLTKSLLELQHSCEVLENRLHVERLKGEEMESKLQAEKVNSENFCLNLKSLKTELEQEKKSSKEISEKLQLELKLAQEETERTKILLSLREKRVIEVEDQNTVLAHFTTDLVQLVNHFAGAKLDIPDVSSCSENEMKNFVEICQKTAIEKFSTFQTRLEACGKSEATVSVAQEGLLETLDADITNLPDRVSSEQDRLEKEDAVQKHAVLEENVRKLQKILEQKDCEIRSLQETLQLTCHRHTEESQKLKNEMENVNIELSEIKQQWKQANFELSEVTSLKARIEEENIVTAQKFQKMSAVLKEKEFTFSEELQRWQLETDTLEFAVKESTNKNNALEEELKSLINKNISLESTLSELTEQNDVLLAAVNTAQDQMKELRETIEENQVKSTKQLEVQSQLQADLDSLKQQNAALISQLETASSDLSRKTEEVNEVRLEADTTKIETERLRSSSASEKSELEVSLEKLQSRFCELQAAMDVVIKEKEDLMALQSALHEEIAELKADLVTSSDDYSNLEQSNQNILEEKNAEIESLKYQLAMLEQNQTELAMKLDSCNLHKTEVDQELMSLKQSSSQQLKELEGHLAESRQEVGELTEQVKTLTSSVSQWEKESRTLEDKAVWFQTSLQEKENSYSTHIESLQQELSALHFQLSSEQLQREQSLQAMVDRESSTADISSRLSEQEAVISELEKELSTLQADMQTERTNQSQQLEELKDLLTSKESECRHLAEELRRTSEKLVKTLSCAELSQRESNAQRNNLDHEMEEMFKEIQLLRSDNEQLKKQLVKAVRDKSVLWQQKDALAYEHKQKTQGKWLDNSSVTKCMKCQVDFSLFLRKHHCRLCGRIFCYNCSNNWFNCTSSRGKARACSQCYTDLQKLDASIAEASLLPDDSDDEECGAENSLASQASNSTDDIRNSPAVSNEDKYSSRISNSPELTDLTSIPLASTTLSDANVSESSSQDGTFQIITQEEVTKSIAAYDDSSANPVTLIDVPNMSSSMMLSAEDLAKGEINRQSEIWIKPGHSFAIPIIIDTPDTIVKWTFTVHPKDIQFSITYHHDNQEPVSQAEVVLAAVRCDSVKEPVQGELTARKSGIYTLVFDNSYSRMTSKNIHYSLQYDA